MAGGSSVQKSGWPVVSRKRHRVAGYVFTPDGQLHANLGLLDYFAPGGILPTEAVFNRRLERANGSFALWLDDGHRRLAAVDRLRSIPLFWSDKPLSGAFHARDLAPNAPPDPVLAHFFREWGHTPFDASLWANVHQLPPGSALAADGDAPPRVWNWFSLRRVGGMTGLVEAELLQLLDGVADRLTDRLTTLAASRPIALALNGDLSSRLLLALLRRVGYPELFCWTYGHPQSSHVALSKAVAQQLACPWFFVDSRRLRVDQLMDATGQGFLLSAHRGAYVPQVAPFLALEALRAGSSFNPEALVIWGGWGDEISGSDLPTAELAQHFGLTHTGVMARLQDQLRNGQARKHRTNNEKVQQLALQQLLAWGPLQSSRDWLALYEAWLLAGPFTLKALSMARAAEHVGCDWMTPLADAEWLQLWFDVPNAFRAEQALFRKWLNERFGRPMGLTFEVNRRAPNRLLGWMHRFRSRQVPSSIVDLTPLALHLAEASGEPIWSGKHRPSEEQVLAAWFLQHYGYRSPVSGAP